MAGLDLNIVSHGKHVLLSYIAKFSLINCFDNKINRRKQE